MTFEADSFGSMAVLMVKWVIAAIPANSSFEGAQVLLVLGVQAG